MRPAFDMQGCKEEAGLKCILLGFTAVLLACSLNMSAQELQSTTASQTQPELDVSNASHSNSKDVKPEINLQERYGRKPARALASYGVPEDRWFFPRHWLRGYTEFQGAPPTNEPDLGRCAQVWASQFGGVSDPCAAYARYLLGGYLELQPVGRTVLRHLFLFYKPDFSFGHNVPQFSYTSSFQPIAYERSLGIGIELPKRFEFRLTQHQVDWLGPYRRNLGAADLHTTGPYGLYATVGMRWYFGGYGHLIGGE